jgi:hypothetical protein
MARLRAAQAGEASGALPDAPEPQAAASVDIGTAVPATPANERQPPLVASGGDGDGGSSSSGDRAGSRRAKQRHRSKDERSSGHKRKEPGIDFRDRPKSSGSKRTQRDGSSSKSSKHKRLKH